MHTWFFFNVMRVLSKFIWLLDASSLLFSIVGSVSSVSRHLNIMKWKHTNILRENIFFLLFLLSPNDAIIHEYYSFLVL